MVHKTQTDFSEVAESAGKVASLVSEIANASTEQSRGIEEVNQAITQMDGVVQRSAANAEESASASEELSAQALQMKEAVNELVMLVKGGQMNNGHAHKKVMDLPVREQINQPHSTDKPVPRLEMTEKGKEVAPEKVIPLDDKEAFTDF